MMHKASTPTCPHPFKYVMVSPDGLSKPCCRFRQTSQWEHKVERHPLAAFSGQLFSEVRAKMQTGQIVVECQKCDDEDRGGIKSMRQRVIDSGAFTRDDRPILEGLEVGFSRLCNLKCRSCNAQFSTRWENDERQMGIHRTFPRSSGFSAKGQEEQLRSLRHLKITGGEPLLSREFEQFIDDLDQLQLLGQIECEIFTNGTVPPSMKLLERLKKFKSLKIGVSVDAFGEANHYIRHPAKWQDVEKSLIIWELFAEGTEQVEISLAITVSLYNIIAFYDLIDWWKQTSPRGRFFIQIAAEPHEISPYNLQPKFADILCDISDRRLAELRQRWEFTLQEIEHLGWVRSALRQVEEGSIKLDQFWSYTQQLDRIRGEHFAKVFPGLYFLIEGAQGRGPEWVSSRLAP